MLGVIYFLLAWLSGGLVVPTYDYSCQDCKEAFTVTVPLSGKGKITCPNCGSNSIIQSFASVSILTGKGCEEPKFKGRPFS